MLKTRTEKQTQTLVDLVFHYDTNPDFVALTWVSWKHQHHCVGQSDPNYNNRTNICSTIESFLSLVAGIWSVSELLFKRLPWRIHSLTGRPVELASVEKLLCNWMVSSFGCILFGSRDWSCWGTQQIIFRLATQDGHSFLFVKSSPTVCWPSEAESHRSLSTKLEQNDIEGIPEFFFLSILLVRCQFLPEFDSIQTILLPFLWSFDKSKTSRWNTKLPSRISTLNSTTVIAIAMMFRFLQTLRSRKVPSRGMVCVE